MCSLFAILTIGLVQAGPLSMLFTTGVLLSGCYYDVAPVEYAGCNDLPDTRHQWFMVWACSTDLLTLWLMW